jgi:hypothetical protein
MGHGKRKGIEVSLFCFSGSFMSLFHCYPTLSPSKTPHSPSRQNECPSDLIAQENCLRNFKKYSCLGYTLKIDLLMTLKDIMLSEKS